MATDETSISRGRGGIGQGGGRKTGSLVQVKDFMGFAGIG